MENEYLRGAEVNRNQAGGQAGLLGEVAVQQRPSMGMVAERADQLFRELGSLSEQFSTVHNRIGACFPPSDAAKSQASLNADNPIDAALSALQGAAHMVNELHNMAIRINERI